MRNDTPIERSWNVRVLGSIALVLFCLNLLIFVDRHFGQEQIADVKWRCFTNFERTPTGWTATPRPRSRYLFKPEHAVSQRYWAYRGGSYFTPANATPTYDEAAPISEELRIRATHLSEADQRLRHKLGLTGQETAHISIMR